MIETTESLEQFIYDLIYNKLNFKHSLKGSKYLLYYFDYAVKNNIDISECSATKTIYPKIGSHFDISSQKVERCIRNSIEVMWNHMDENTKIQYFSKVSDIRPTNMEFMCTIYDYIKRYGNLEEHNKKDMRDDNYVIDEYIYQLIYNKLGFKHSIKGPIYLIFYIDYAIKNNYDIYSCGATKMIYPTIALHFNTTPEKVERAIRSSIDILWDSLNEKIKKEIFPIIKDSRPTNTEAIYAIYEYVRTYGNQDKYNNESKNNNYKIRFELQRKLEELFQINSQFGITKLQILVDAIMIVLEMDGVNDNEMNYIITKLSNKYGLPVGKFNIYDEYIQIDAVTPILYNLCKQIYSVDSINFPIPEDKRYVKTYLNVLADQIKKQV